MADKITTIDVNTTSPEIEIHETIKKWAVEEKFSVYEKDKEGIIYHKNIRFNTAWLQVKEKDGKTQIEAWLAPKGLKPEATGNMWKGYKVPVQSGFAIGPAAIYKKQYGRLIETLENKLGSTIQINKTSSDQPRIKKESFTNVFIFLSALALLSGSLSLFSGYISFDAPYATKDSQNIFVTSGIFDILMGIIYLVIARLLKKGKLLAIWLYGFTIVLNIIYSQIMIGAKFPYFPVIFGVFTISLLWELKKSGELS